MMLVCDVTVQLKEWERLVRCFDLFYSSFMLYVGEAKTKLFEDFKEYIFAHACMHGETKIIQNMETRQSGGEMDEASRSFRFADARRRAPDAPTSNFSDAK